LRRKPVLAVGLLTASLFYNSQEYVAAKDMNIAADSSMASEKADSIVPGPLEAERHHLAEMIHAASGHGIGTSAYQSAFSRIEQQVQAGATENDVKAQIEQLSTALLGQIKVAEQSNASKIGVRQFGFSKDGHNSNPTSNSSQPVIMSSIDSRPRGDYMRLLSSRIKRAWFPPAFPVPGGRPVISKEEVRNVVVTFGVNEFGKPANLQIKQSSGFALADKVALKAIQNADLPMPPDGHPISVEFTFDRNLK